MFILVEWILEGLFNIISFKNIVSPRKEYEDYAVGDDVTANFQRQPYPARILAKSSQKQELEVLLDDPEKLKRIKASHCCNQMSKKGNSLADNAEKRLQNENGKKKNTKATNKELTTMTSTTMSLLQSSLTVPSRVLSQEPARSPTPPPKRLPSSGSPSEVSGGQSMISPSFPVNGPHHDAELLKRLKDVEEKAVEHEEEIRSLRRKVRKLEKKLEDSSSCHSDERSKSAVAPKPPASSPDDSEKDDLLASLQAVPDKDVIKTLALKVFSVAELQNCSVTGKRSAQSTQGNSRPALDPVRLATMEKVAHLKLPSISRKDFVEKLQNVQKVLRKK